MPERQARHFRAMLERGDKALGWTIARVPFNPATVWPTMIRLRVRGQINGVEFRTSLFPDPRGGYYLLVNQAMQRAGGVLLGESAAFALMPDLEERPADLPDDLASLLEDEPGLRAWYDALTEYTRREIGKWCNGAKGDAAKQRRAAQTAERLLSAMEAERELPPAIVRAFRERPRACTGWAHLSETQRRSELLAVFYYQTPEAQERRIGKLCDLAETRAGKVG